MFHLQVTSEANLIKVLSTLLLHLTVMWEQRMILEAVISSKALL